MRTKYKPWALPYLKEHKDIAYISFDKNDSFYDDSLCLEIGGGKGDFIVGIATLNVKTHYLMIEKVVSIVAPAVKKIIDNKLNNVRIIYDNFINIARDIPNESINKIYLNFSDPWPKKRHEKRRLTAPTFLNDYHRILKKNGEIVIKTDQEKLYEFSKLMLINNAKFSIVLDNPHYNNLDSNDIITEYEAKFRKEGKNIYRLVVKKI